MNSCTRPARINTKALLILVSIVGLAGIGAVSVHFVQKRRMADRALAQGRAALAEQDWPLASQQLRRYLGKYPDDVDVLEEYATATLKIQPLKTEHIGKAIAAYRRLHRIVDDRPKYAHQLAKLYHAVGSYDEAKHTCRKLLERDAEDAQALLWMARSLVTLRRYTDAVPFLTRLVQSHPTKVEAYRLLSLISMSEGNGTAALDWLTRGVEANPESAAARVHRAVLARTSSTDKVKVRGDLEAAESLEPKDPRVMLALADEWAYLGDLHRAKRWIGRAAEFDRVMLHALDIPADRFAQARFMVAARIALLSDDVEAGLALIDQTEPPVALRERVAFVRISTELLVAGDRISQARQFLEKHRSYVEPYTSADPRNASAFCIAEAIVLDAEDRPYEVIDALLPVVGREAAQPDAWRLLAQAFDRTDQPRRYVRALQEYVARNPTNQAATIALAKAHRNNDWTQVQQLSQRILTAEPQNRDARLLSIEATLNGAGAPLTPAGWQSLSAELASFQHKHPEDATIRRLLQLALRAQGRTEDAKEYLEARFSTGTAELSELLELSELHEARGAADEALVALSQAATRFKKRADAYLALAAFHTRHGALALAMQRLEAALDVLDAEEQVKARIALGQLMLEHGDRQQGIDFLWRITKENPTHLRTRLVLLALPEVGGDGEAAQQLVDEIRVIEGETGLQWRLEQAQLWLRSSDWRGYASQMHELLNYCRRMDPGWRSPALVLGRLYEREGRWAEAENVYRQFIYRFPHESDVAKRLLVLLENQRRSDEAWTVLRGIPITDEQLREHQIKLAVRQGKIEEAIPALETRILNNPTDAAARVLHAQLVFLQSGDTTRTLAILETAAEADPNMVAVIAARANVLRASGRSDEALALIDGEVERRGDAAIHLLRAAFHEREGRTKLAEADYRRVLALTDVPPSAFLSIGAFYERKKSPGRMVEVFEEGLKQYPDDAQLQLATVGTLLRTENERQRQRGLDLLADWLVASPDRADLLVLQAMQLAEQPSSEQLAQAKRQLLRANEMDPTYDAAYVGLIQLAIKQGDNETARKWSARAMSAAPNSLRVLMAVAEMELDAGNDRIAHDLAWSVLEIDPSFLPARSLLTKVALQYRSYDWAKKLSDDALVVNSSDRNTIILRAEVLELGDRRSEAIAELQRICPVVPQCEDVEVLLLLARLYRLDNSLGLSEDAFEAAAKLAPDTKDLFVERVKWLQAQGRYDDILDIGSARHHAFPSEMDSLHASAALLSRSTQRDHVKASRRLYENLIKLDEENAEVFLEFAQLLAKLGENEASAEAFHRVLELTPNHLQATNNLGWLLAVELGRAEEAVRILDGGLNDHPASALLHNTRGMALIKLRKFTEAQESLNEALGAGDATDFTRAYSWSFMGRAQMEQGRAKVARASFERALLIDDQHRVLSTQERGDIKQLLKSLGG